MKIMKIKFGVFFNILKYIEEHSTPPKWKIWIIWWQTWIMPNLFEENSESTLRGPFHLPGEHCVWQGWQVCCVPFRSA